MQCFLTATSDIPNSFAMCVIGFDQTGTVERGRCFSPLSQPSDYHSFFRDLLSFSAASFGRKAQRRHWRDATRLHLAAMGVSYAVADRFLRRQRQESSDVESASAKRVLAGSVSARCACHRLRTIAASIDATLGMTDVKSQARSHHDARRRFVGARTSRCPRQQSSVRKSMSALTPV